MKDLIQRNTRRDFLKGGVLLGTATALTPPIALETQVNEIVDEDFKRLVGRACSRRLLSSPLGLTRTKVLFNRLPYCYWYGILTRAFARRHYLF